MIHVRKVREIIRTLLLSHSALLILMVETTSVVTMMTYIYAPNIFLMCPDFSGEPQ